MSLWFCTDCKIAYGPQPHCPRCGKSGVWQGALVDREMEMHDSLDNAIRGAIEMRGQLERLRAEATAIRAHNTALRERVRELEAELAALQGSAKPA